MDWAQQRLLSLCSVGFERATPLLCQATSILRGICAHPEAAQDAAGPEAPHGGASAGWIALSPKLAVLATMLEHCLGDGECLIVKSEAKR